MTVAIMQPYFFPYVGYWQLIQAADHFVLLDDAQYMRHGWINRNRILKPGGGWQYVVVPLEKHSLTAPISAVKARADNDWRDLIIRQLAHYRKKAGHYEETIELVSRALANKQDGIAQINSAVIRELCRAFGIKTKVTISSEYSFNYDDVECAGDWAHVICQQLGASRYINPIGGANLFDQRKFASKNIALEFLKPGEIVYSQRQPFEPSLSIIDVLMFNGIDQTKTLIGDYSIEAKLQ